MAVIIARGFNLRTWSHIFTSSSNSQRGLFDPRFAIYIYITPMFFYDLVHLYLLTREPKVEVNICSPLSNKIKPE